MLFILFMYVFYYQLTDADQELYKNFSITISERWQNEVAETVFETVNAEADKADQKRKSRQKKFNEHNEEGTYMITYL